MGLPGPSQEIGRVEDTLTSFGGGMMGSPGPGHGVGRVEDTLTSVRLREGWALAPFPFSWSRSIGVYGQWCPLICLFRSDLTYLGPRLGSLWCSCCLITLSYSPVALVGAVGLHFYSTNLGARRTELAFTRHRKRKSITAKYVILAHLPKLS